MFVVIATVITLLLAYIYSKRKNSYFSNYGVKTLPPWPFVGNLGQVTLGKANFVDAIGEGYKAFKDERYFGLYQYMIPTIIPKDPELIRQIVSQDFDIFPNRGVHIDHESDELFGRNLIMLRGKKWKEMRSAITPAFTSSKVRAMMPFMLECADDAMNFFSTQVHQNNAGYFDIDTNIPVTAYVNDVIASCAFGFRVNTHQQRNNEIFELGQTAVIQYTTQIMKFFGYENFPRLMKFFRIKIIDTSSANLFRKLFTGAMKLRYDNNNSRPDFIQILMEAKKGTLKQDDINGFPDKQEAVPAINPKYTDDDLVAQAVLFYVAGFDTSSNLVNFLLYEMAINPDVQAKLQAELDAADEDGDLYETIQELKYLDMVVCEVLRLWPLVGSADRRSVATYDFGPTRHGGTERLIARPDVHVWLPILSLHRDPQYWQEPDRCRPERFSDENRVNIRPYTYIPFGQGPRYCIGSRFAVLAAKVLVFKTLREYAVSPAPRTVLPVQVSKRAFILHSANGFWLRMTKRIKT